ncbi:alpha/beta fold hydrolase [Streptosporangium roseum]|uniref:alpha/beta fold hydrolase n=1 Tax=Streptosporangium roseum TaxID=2001 RepID=UPI0031E534BA
MLVPPTFVTVSEGHRLAVRRGGHGGVPLLLLHGFPCTSLIWSHNVEPLAAAGFDVAAPTCAATATPISLLTASTISRRSTPT